MAYIYYCKSCKDTYSAETDNVDKFCPKCMNKMVATHITADEWQTKTKEEKAELKKEFDKLEIETSKSSSEKSNTIGEVVEVVGWISIVLTIVGAISIACSEDGITAFNVAISGCIGGLLLVALGEIINLLQDIKNK